MIDILSLFLETKPIATLSPKIAEAYYEPVEEDIPIVSKPDPITTNCYAYIAQYVKLPPTREILPNTAIYPGVVAIFQYKVKHYALVEKLTEEGFVVKESNYTPGVIGERFIKWNDPKLIGFFDPTSYYKTD